MSSPVFSVIVNCYNGERYLKEAIDSIICQTFTDYELIFWDNQSTDGSKSILETYGDSRIYYHYAKNHTPLGQARNMAMKMAKGIYISFLDIDDIWDKEFLRTAYSILNTHENYSGYYSNYYQFNSKLLRVYQKKCKSGSRSLKDLLKHYDVGMSCSVVRRDIIDKYNITFNEQFCLVEDFEFYLKVAKVGPLYYDENPMARYRMHDDSLTYKMKNGWACEFRELHKNLVQTILNKEEILKYKSELRWLEVRACNVELNEAIYENDRKKVFTIVRKNWHISTKLLIGILFILFGRENYYKILFWLKGSNYHL